MIQTGESPCHAVQASSTRKGVQRGDTREVVLSMVSRAEVRETDTNVRLAVIEEKLEMVLSELAAMRAYIPGKIIEHSERLSVLERNMRTIQWLGGVIAVALIGAFIAHVLHG
jgi:hypothetical protein